MFPTSVLFRPVQMHIPDGFLSLGVSLIFWTLTVVFVGVAIYRTRDELGERQVPLMGIMAAFIFAAQMFNFPIPGGTSGHLLGGVLAAILLGPWGGILTMASVIIVQGILFQDGGLLTMGANIFNMGVLTALIGAGLYRLVSLHNLRIRLALAGAAAWISVVGAALAASLELWLSGTSALAVVVPAMLSVHALIGIGEALITMAALAFVQQARPDLLDASSPGGPPGQGWVVGGLAMSLAVLLLAPLASANPDGLERVAHDLGFMAREAEPPFRLLADYTVPWLHNAALSTLLAGLIGTLVIAALAFGVARALRRRATA